MRLESLRMMNLRDPEELMKKKPYELSGGMCQTGYDCHCHVHETGLSDCR